MPDVQLLHGDCLDLLPTLTPASVDLVLADLPYGTTACKWDCPIDLTRLWKEYKRVLKAWGAVVLTGSQPFTSALVMSNPAWFRHEWIWEKSKATGHAACNQRPLKAHESILVFAPQAPIYHPQKGTGVPYKSHFNRVAYALRPEHPAFDTGDIRNDNPTGERYPRSVLQIRNAYYDDGKQVHPTQKPVALMAYLIRTYSNPGAVVLDNTMGSGTTGVACIETGRAFIGIERDPAYFAIAERRIAAAQPALPEAACA